LKYSEIKAAFFFVYASLSTSKTVYSTIKEAKKQGFLMNFLKSLTTDLNDIIQEGNSSQSASSPDTALSAILGGLKLYDGDPSHNRLWDKYISTDTLYDIIIRINNISDLRTQGWEILLSKHAKTIVPTRMIFAGDTASSNSLFEQRKGIIATVLGAYNRGKSYLLKKLCKIELPAGNLISTEGISITAGKENYRNLVFLDTAGTDTAVKNDEITSKKATEALLREVVLHLSTVIIIVVNRLRASDQIYINEV
jgi:hypothetical protein